MARNDGRIEAGQRLSAAISARAWNRAQQAADVVLGAGFGSAGEGAQNGSAPYTFVYAKNGTGSDIARWGIMAITGVEVTPTSSGGGATAQFEQMPVLTCATFSNGSPWCVAVEPITNGKIGRVAIAGAVQVKAADLSKVSGSTVLWQNADWALIRFGGGGSSSPPLRLAQTSGEWPNEPPLNVKAVQLFKQPNNPAGPADWVPETDEYGDPVFAVTINWFSHIPVGQGDLIKWCAVVPISDLAGEYDTGQVTYNDGVESPIMRAYDKLWLLIAVEC